MRIATWNVNSIRARVQRVTDFLLREDIDVLAMQETKCKAEQFPTDAFTDLGYQVAHVGFNQWNGVAVVSKVGMDEITIGLPNQPAFGDPPVQEARAIGARCNGVRVWSLYIPNGRELDHPHYDYKLRFFEQLAAMTKELAADDTPLALCGDFNVAPFDDDVWDPEFFADKTHTSDAERSAFNGVLDAGVVDVVRPEHPGPGVYTYWDYTQLRFPKKQGMRIDYVLGSQPFADRVASTAIVRDERKGKGASDHCPVVVTLNP